MTSDDGEGQGIVVLNVGKRSFLKHAIFENLSAPQSGGWALTGAVSFYQSPVDIVQCLFKGNHDSDDSLHIIRSEFSIRQSLFEDSLFDALDIDFSQGQVVDTSFVRSGVTNGNGDAIDFSGSVVTLNNIVVDQVGDKGLSVGERSIVDAANVHITRAVIAAASKDCSELKLKHVKIGNSETGFALYQKKPEFGPAKIEARQVDFLKVKQIYLIRDGSVLVIDGKRVVPDTPIKNDD